MKQLLIITLLASLLLSACGTAEFECVDPLGCVLLEGDDPITLGAALTLSGPDSPYGIDALRGVELAISDHGAIYGHELNLITADDKCSAAGGEAAALDLLANPSIVGVIGTTCSSGTTSAARILSDAGLVLISPSSTAASLTDPAKHQLGFLRTIYNDKNQAQLVANFAFNALGVLTMAGIHDGTPYSKELVESACEAFEQFGGECIAVEQIVSGEDVLPALKRIASRNPEALYYPLYTTDGVAVTKDASAAGLLNVALISSDGLLSSDFLTQAGRNSDGMYISGPSVLDIDPAFFEAYRARYKEEPIAVYAAQAYDATRILLNAIESAGIQVGSRLYIPRAALRRALFATHNYEGLSGIITCSNSGDCAAPNIVIYQVNPPKFTPIYP